MVVEVDVPTDEGVLVTVRLITRMVPIAVLVIQLFAYHTYQCNGKDTNDYRRTRGEHPPNTLGKLAVSLVPE